MKLQEFREKDRNERINSEVTFLQENRTSGFKQSMDVNHKKLSTFSKV